MSALFALALFALSLFCLLDPHQSIVSLVLLFLSTTHPFLYSKCRKLHHQGLPNDPRRQEKRPVTSVEVTSGLKCSLRMSGSVRGRRKKKRGDGNMTKRCLTRHGLCLQVCGILLFPVLLLTFSEVPSSLRAVTGTPTIYEHSTTTELDTHLDISGAKSLIGEID